MLCREWFADVAEVTSKGIEYNGLYYSCEMAIKEQWFHKASTIGTWKITVNIDPHDLSCLMLSEYEGVVCRSIEHRFFTGKKLDEYFSLIEIFKQSKQKFNKLRGGNFG